MAKIEQHRIKNWFEWVRYEDGHHNRRLLTYKDAVSVEWIEKYISKLKDDGMIYLSSAGCIKDMLKEWEKANEESLAE